MGTFNTNSRGLDEKDRSELVYPDGKPEAVETASTVLAIDKLVKKVKKQAKNKSQLPPQASSPESKEHTTTMT